MLVEEIFVPIIGYEGLYEISNTGKAKSTKIHRLVATHFLENPGGLRDVNHGTRNLRANNTKSKEVYQFTKDGELVAKFRNGYEAQEVTKIKESSISACCNGRRKTAGGFKWSFYAGSKKE